MVDLRNAVQEKDDVIAGLRDQVEILLKEKEELANRERGQQTVSVQKETEITRLKEEVTVLRESHTREVIEIRRNCDIQINQLTILIQELRVELETYKSEVQDLTVANKALTDNNGAQSDDYHVVLERCQGLHETYAQVCAQLQALADENRMLREQLDLLRATMSTSPPPEPGKKKKKKKNHPKLGLEVSDGIKFGTKYGGKQAYGEIRVIAAWGPGEEAGIQQNDFIRSVNGRQVTTLKDFKEVIELCEPRQAVRMEIERNSEHMHVVITPAASEQQPGAARYHNVVHATFVPPSGGSRSASRMDESSSSTPRGAAAASAQRPGAQKK